MNKEALLALQLTEEQVNKVIEGFGHMVPKTRLDDKISQVNALTAQVTDYTGQLEELKKVDAEGLQSKIAELQEANTTAQAAFAKELLDTQVKTGLTLALQGKVHDIDVALGLIDRESLVVADGKITGGLDEQIKTLKESKSYLFVPEGTETPTKQKISGAIPHTASGTGKADPVSVGVQFAQTANAVPSSAAKNPWGQ